MNTKQLRPEVLAFAQLMEQRLRSKDAERGTSWKHMHEGDLMVPAAAKTYAMDRAMQNDDRDAVIKHAIDVGNYCMFIADATGALEIPEV